MSIKEDDLCTEAKLHYAGQKRAKKMNSVKSMVAKAKRKNCSRDNDQKATDHLKNINTKMIIDFDCESSVGINSLAVNKTNVVKLTTRLFSVKMFMFTKLSLMSFIYDLIEVFYFPNIKAKIIYQSFGIEKILLYQILTDSDSIALHFNIICSENNSIPDDRFRDIIFEVISQNDIIKRFATSNEYWEKFSVRDKTLEKKLGYFEIENIDNPCQIVLAINPKEYYKYFEDFTNNKNQKGQKKGTSGMNFENFALRIATSNQIDNFDVPKNKYQEQERFSIFGGEMQKSVVTKTKFSQTNDKKILQLK